MHLDKKRNIFICRIYLKEILNKYIEWDGERERGGGGGRNYRSSVCLRNVFTSRRGYLPSSRLFESGHPRAELSGDGFRDGWKARRRKGEGGREGEGVGCWKYHLSRTGLSISAALIR